MGLSFDARAQTPVSQARSPTHDRSGPDVVPRDAPPGDRDIALASSTEATERWYRLPLALAYLVPTTVFVSTLAVNTNNPDPPYALLATAGVGMFAAPPIVHAVHSNGSGAGWALLGTFGSVTGGYILGVIFGAALGSSGSSSCNGSADEFCGWSGGSGAGAVVGAVVGSSLGYIGWATIDTVYFAHTTRHRPMTRTNRTTTVALTPTLLPLMSNPTRSKPVALDGITLGAIATF